MIFYKLTLSKTQVLGESQAGIAGRNINNLRYADDTSLMVESKEELKSLLMKTKEGSEKARLKLNIQKTNIMASGPITSWQIDGEKVEAVTNFFFLGLQNHCKITAKDENLGRVLKSRDITLPTKVHIVKSYGFSSSHVQM